MQHFSRSQRKEAIELCDYYKIDDDLRKRLADCLKDLVDRQRKPLEDVSWSAASRVSQIL